MDLNGSKTLVLRLPLYLTYNFSRYLQSHNFILSYLHQYIKKEAHEYIIEDEYKEAWLR